MPPLTLTIALALDPPITEPQARQIARDIAGRLDHRALGPALGPHGALILAFGSTTAEHPGTQLSALHDAALAETDQGRRVTVVELSATGPNADARLVTLPALIAADAFRQLLLNPDGEPISRQRFHVLRHTDGFPREVAPDVWLQSSAVHYAAGRHTTGVRPAAEEQVR